MSTASATLVMSYIFFNIDKEKLGLYNILKVAHLADVLHMERWGRFIISEQSNDADQISLKGTDIDLDSFSDSDLECLDEVIAIAKDRDLAEVVIETLKGKELLLGLHRHRWD